MTEQLAVTDLVRSLHSSRSAARVLTLYVVIVFVAAALGAPWLYRAVATAAVHVPVLAPLTAHPLHRYLQRLLLVFALATLPTLLRRLGLRRWRDLGLAHPRMHGRELAVGALLGATVMLAAAVVPVVAGARVIDPSASIARVVGRVLSALAVAPFVAFLEEFIFRGVIDGGLRRARASNVAIAASSAFYAAVHFLARPHAPTSVTWSAGLSTLGGMLAGLGEFDTLVPAFLTLWLVGAYLGALYHRAGTLLANVGVHAGGIFVLQLYGLVTTETQSVNRHVWGTGRLVDGWATLAVLVAAGAIGKIVCERRAPRVEVAGPVEIEGASAAA